MDFFKLIVDKLSQYNLLTNIIPGTILCVSMKYLVGYDLIPEESFQAGIVFYFAGVVNGRVGSLIVEPILKKIYWVTFVPYSRYVKAEQKDSKMQMLNQENNVYRSYVSVSLILLLAFCLQELLDYYAYSLTNEKIMLIVGLLVLFLFSYKKQTNYICNRVDTVLKDSNNQSDVNA